jgi:hypothetical protein
MNSSIDLPIFEPTIVRLRAAPRWPRSH